jgi:hypothetical protein
MDNTESFTFNLSKPIKIQGQVDGKNEFIECDELHLIAPSLKQMRYSINLKKKFGEALFGFFTTLNKSGQAKAEVKAEEESKGLKAKEIIQSLYLAEGFDIASFFDEFKSLLVSGVCFTDVNQSNRIRPSDLDKVSLEDTEDLTGKYIEVFFISSWMKIFSQK